jgi:hypothetical protein
MSATCGPILPAPDVVVDDDGNNNNNNNNNNNECGVVGGMRIGRGN